MGTNSDYEVLVQYEAKEKGRQDLWFNQKFEDVDRKSLKVLALSAFMHCTPFVQRNATRLAVLNGTTTLYDATEDQLELLHLFEDVCIGQRKVDVFAGRAHSA